MVFIHMYKKVTRIVLLTKVSEQSYNFVTVNFIFIFQINKINQFVDY